MSDAETAVVEFGLYASASAWRRPEWNGGELLIARVVDLTPNPLHHDAAPTAADRTGRDRTGRRSVD